MKNSQTKSSHRRVVHAARALFLMLLAAGTAAWSADGPVGEEQAVIQAVSTLLSHEAAEPYDFLYFESDFSASKHVASSMANPDRTQFCGLSREQAQAMVNELAEASSSKPLQIDGSVAKQAGLKVGHKKLPRFRYLFVSRVVFAPDQKQAWLAVDLNGETGSILKFEKIEGQWSKTARCGGWVRAEG